MFMFTTKDFSFHSDTKALVAECSDLQLNGFPHLIAVKSWHTGRVINFAPDAEECDRNEFWDGEMMVYRPVVEHNMPKMNVRKLVLIND